jgi:hypothetical protein
LIYSDVRSPRWLTVLLQSGFGRDAGIFATDDLDRSFANLGFRVLRRVPRALYYEAVFVK